MSISGIRFLFFPLNSCLLALTRTHDIDNVTTKPTQPMDLGLPTKSYIWHGIKVDLPMRYTKLNIVVKYATKLLLITFLGLPIT